MEFTTITPMFQPRAIRSATRLSDGRVLVTGGLSLKTAAEVDFDQRLLREAETYDPAAGQWASAGAMAEARSAHTATLLPDGRVAIVGGHADDGTTLASVELFDPASGTWLAAGSLVERRSFHTATLLPDGRLLIVGGSPTEAAPEVYDPATGTSVLIDSPGTMRSQHSATLLSDGSLMLIGGKDGGGDLITLTEVLPAAR